MKSRVDRIEYLDHLIRIRSTGSPAQLARRMHMSQRCLYNYVSLLRELGAPVRFCRKRNSYYYEEEGRFCFRFIRNTDAAVKTPV